MEKNIARKNKLVLVDRKNESDVKEEKDLEDDAEFQTYFEKYVEKARLNRYKLIIEHYKHISENITFLKRLKELKHFVIQDFKDLTAETIPLIIKHITERNKNKSEKIQVAIRLRKTEGKSIGNPNIDKQVDIATRTRIHNAIFNSRNIEAAKEIFKLRHQDYKDYHIAEELNKRNILSRKGAKFYAKSVRRIADKYLELLPNYKGIPFYDRWEMVASKSTLAEINGLEKNYTKEDAIDFTVNIKKDFLNARLTILDWNRKEIESYQITNNFQEIKLGAAEKNIDLFPGKYYVKIEADNTKEFIPFYIEVEFMEMLKINKET